MTRNDARTQAGFGTSDYCALHHAQTAASAGAAIESSCARVRAFCRDRISCMRQADGQQIDIGRRAVPLPIGNLDRSFGEHPSEKRFLSGASAERKGRLSPPYDSW